MSKPRLVWPEEVAKRGAHPLESPSLQRHFKPTDPPRDPSLVASVDDPSGRFSLPETALKLLRRECGRYWVRTSDASVAVLLVLTSAYTALTCTFEEQ